MTTTPNVLVNNQKKKRIISSRMEIFIFANSLVKYRYVVRRRRKKKIHKWTGIKEAESGLPIKFDWQYHFSFLFRETTTLSSSSELEITVSTNESRLHEVKSVTLSLQLLHHICTIKIIRQNCIDDYYYYYYCQGYIRFRYRN